MVLLLLYTVRTDMLNDWQRSLPDDAPNHFIINVQPGQVDAMQQSLYELGVSTTQLYPMLRSRLVEINHEKVSAEDYDTPRAKRLATREFNLSTSSDLSSDNTITSGRWWSQAEQDEHLISIEQGLAETLNIRLGDVLSFDINGAVTDFAVSSLREVDWDTFNINFFAIVSPGSVQDVPMSWITSVYLNQEQRLQLGKLVKRFPNITIIDTATIMQRVRSIISRVSLAVEFIFLFTLVAGLAVLYAAIQSDREQRRFENAILRTLGAQRSTLLTGLLAEFLVLGLLSGALAGAAASGLAMVLAEWVFKFDYQFDGSLVLLGIISGIAVVTLAGIAGTYRVITQPPLATLRQSAARYQ
jgi:putative ABC transport system permease protein